ncbi:uncharacterized protein FOMMEDRAFT_31784 [Fomitiporia mediterranea MF3/22]|uniref:uncharacterized protein n=1 Tax=Fomitiporia mediterranea (strain MF3/22) TaxID=694068 RepID=UPI00044074ED|nr:uncharacterized protein FOMMEDRAFT_31784 [Fomitiporia mediterranea MF3/22]EJC98785.1 hypothetical protein FOMMEDRAFT_31784 [Fomitiporia mediterranea MF3/22]
MLVLSSLNKLLGQVLSPPALHTAVLFTASGALVSFASAATRPKDDIRVLVGLASEVWAETREDGEGMVDSELGRIIVLPVVSVPKQEGQPPKDPALLIALNATDDIEWGDLQLKGQNLAAHLAKPLQQVQDKLDAAPPPPSKSGRR